LVGRLWIRTLTCTQSVLSIYVPSYSTNNISDVCASLTECVSCFDNLDCEWRSNECQRMNGEGNKRKISFEKMSMICHFNNLDEMEQNCLEFKLNWKLLC
jgi:hypothetical protein